jgi:hypothetical protein
LRLTEVTSHLQFVSSSSTRDDDLPVTLEHDRRNERVGVTAEAHGDATAVSESGIQFPVADVTSQRGSLVSGLLFSACPAATISQFGWSVTAKAFRGIVSMLSSGLNRTIPATRILPSLWTALAEGEAIEAA